MDIASSHSSVLVSFNCDLATSCISSNFFSFQATFCIPSNIQLSIISEELEQLLVLKLALLPHFTVIKQTIYQFSVKQSQIPLLSRADHGCKMHAAGLLRLKNIHSKWWKKIHTRLTGVSPGKNFYKININFDDQVIQQGWLHHKIAKRSLRSYFCCTLAFASDQIKEESNNFIEQISL